MTEKNSLRLWSMPWLGKTVIALGVVWSTYIAANAWVKVKMNRAKPTISITGSAKKRIVSDLIEWRVHLHAQGLTRQAAYGALQQSVNTTREYLLGQKVAPAEIAVGSADIGERYRTEFREFKEEVMEIAVPDGFEASQSITVTSKNVGDIERISREVTGLLEQGIEIRSDSPRYYYTKLSEMKIAMLAEAAGDARQRAQEIIASAGNRDLGILISADMGVININPANSTATSWEGNNDVTSLEKDIITIVHATFELD